MASGAGQEEEEEEEEEEEWRKTSLFLSLAPSLARHFCFFCFLHGIYSELNVSALFSRLWKRQMQSMAPE